MGSEVLLPHPGRELVDTIGGRLAKALQDIDRIVAGVDLVQATGHDPDLEDADVPGAEFGPAEQPIATPHRNRPQSAFKVAGVDRYLRIEETDFQPASSLAGIRECLGQRVAGSQALGFEALIDPGEEALGDRFGLRLTLITLLDAGELLLTDRFFDLVQLTDDIQGLRGGFRFDGLCFEEAAAGMRPALGVPDPGPGDVTGLGSVAVREQDTAFDRRQAESRFNVFGLATFEAQEADLIEFAIHRPEAGGLELARNPLTGLDRRLVHGLDARGANRGGLVDQPPGDEAHVGPAAVDDAGGCGGAD